VPLMERERNKQKWNETKRDTTETKQDKAKTNRNTPPSSSLLQGKHLPFTPSPLRFNMFRLFVNLSLTQLYRRDISLFDCHI
jgi:hypothetical protein